MPGTPGSKEAPTFQPAKKCDYWKSCLLYGYCYGAYLIRTNLNENDSACDSPAAAEARQYVRDVYAGKIKP